MAQERKPHLINPDQKMAYGISQVLGQYRNSLQKDIDWTNAALAELAAVDSDSDTSSEPQSSSSPRNRPS